MISFLTIGFFLVFYSIISIIFWIVVSFIDGICGRKPSTEDFFESLIWPVTLANLFGLVFRAIFFNIKNKKSTKGNNL